MRQSPRGPTSTVYVFFFFFCNRNQPSWPTPFPLTCVYFCLIGPFNYVSFHKLTQRFSAFSLCSSDLVSALLVFSTVTLKPGVGQHITIHVTLTARDFCVAYFYPSDPFTCICFQNRSGCCFFLPILTVANSGSCVSQ